MENKNKFKFKFKLKSKKHHGLFKNMELLSRICYNQEIKRRQDHTPISNIFAFETKLVQNIVKMTKFQLQLLWYCLYSTTAIISVYDGIKKYE